MYGTHDSSSAYLLHIYLYSFSALRTYVYFQRLAIKKPVSQLGTCVLIALDAFFFDKAVSQLQWKKYEIT